MFGNRKYVIDNLIFIPGPEFFTSTKTTYSGVVCVHLIAM